jgi:predicted nucleic acid-binding protein
VSTAVVLDTGPLGILINPNHTPLPIACRAWLASLQAAGRQVILPEIADYEVRRELIRANLSAALYLLDQFAVQLDYLPLTTPAMRLAADLWAQARKAGLPSAAAAALDGDVILAAQALTLGAPVVIATGNPAHLSRFVPAEDWTAITP